MKLKALVLMFIYATFSFRIFVLFSLVSADECRDRNTSAVFDKLLTDTSNEGVGKRLSCQSSNQVKVGQSSGVDDVSNADEFRKTIRHRKFVDIDTSRKVLRIAPTLD